MTLVPVNGTAIAAPTALGQSELDTLRRTIGHDLDNNEFELFAAICRRTGLDPFARQIYAVKRYDKRQGREVMQIQTGIDGLRLIAERSRHYAGQTPVEWCGPDSNWVDVWLSDQPPAAARVGVLRDDFREPVYAVAKFSSYCATTRDGKPQSLWATMPEVMIAKCAEALAIRKAFPNDVSGVYTREEMAQQHNADGPPLATEDQVARIDALLPLVPADAMPELKAWKADQGISMKAGEFTAEAADAVIGKLEELTSSPDGGGTPPVSTVGVSQPGDDTPEGVPGGASANGPVSSPAAPPAPWKDTDEDAWGRWNRRCQAKARGTKDKPGVLDADDTIRDAQRHGLALQASRKRETPVESWSDLTEAEAVALEDALDLLKGEEAVMVQDAAGRWSCDRVKVEAGGTPTPQGPHGAADPPASVSPPPESVTGGGAGPGEPRPAVDAPSGDDDIVDAEIVEDDTLDLLRTAIANKGWSEGKALKRARDIGQELGLERLPSGFETLPKYPRILERLAAELVAEVA